MPSPVFALRPDETLLQGVPRLLAAFQIEARRLARPAERKRSDAVHDGRVLLKRLRAFLWFLTPALGKTVSTEAKQRLRHASKLLAPLRDAAVARETLQKLAQKTSRKNDLKALTRVAETLRAPHGAGSLLGQAMDRTDATLAFLRKEAAEVKEWPPIPSRLDKALRQFRRAGKKARQTEKAIHFHAWRKKAKRLLYLLEMMHPAGDEASTDFIRRLDRLQDTLGMGHDYTIGRETLRPDPAKPVKRVDRLLQQQEKHFEAKSEKRARHLKRLS